MNITQQYDASFADDKMVEANIPMSCLAPDCISDAGVVRQGGLHRIFPWFFGSLLGGGE